jgi:acetyl esterase/lipase
MAALAEQSAATPAPARGDWKALRQAGEHGQAYLATLVPVSSGVQTATFHTTSNDGAPIELRWYTATGQARARAAQQPEAGPGPAVVYAHGGGMVMGTLDLYDEVISWYVGQTGVPFLSVGYRLLVGRVPART